MPGRRRPRRQASDAEMDAAPSAPFAALLRRHRLAAGLSQEELAERAGLSVQAIGALERGLRRAPYRDTVDLLAEALSLTPEQRGQFVASVPRRRGNAAAPAPPDPARTNLPRPISSFVGREQEQATVLRLLESSRLLTLTGTGGVGKTRLATHVAAGLSMAPAYPDGVWLVELAALTDPARVPETIARVLGLRELPGTPILDTLTAVLRERALLLILDNCEHLRDGIAELVEALLRACPNLRILATSREALGTIGETVWWVPSLGLPAAAGVGFWVSGDGDRGASTDLPNTQHLTPNTQSDAVRLFCERAAAAHPAFALSDANAAAVEAICRRLDGIPLALELAAARARILTPEQIAARLDERFRLLTGGSPEAPLRQQTLRAALDWSYELLSAPERLLLERLSVFGGGCRIEAAEAVCVGEDVAPEALFDLITGLVEKSLLVVEYRGDAARYRLLETVRQYAQERFAARSDAEPIRRRCLDWALDLAERAAPHLEGPDQAAWLDRLEIEHDNLRTVLLWTLDHDQATLGLQLAGRLGMFWQRRGLLTEGQQWLEHLLARGVGAPVSVRAVALLQAGMLAEQQGAFDAATQYVEQSLDLFREIGDQRRTSSALGQLGSLAWRRSDFARSTACFEESLAIARDIDSPALISRCLNSLGVLATDQGHLQTAHAHFKEALAIARTLGDAGGIAVRLNNLAMVAIRLGDLPLARMYAEEALAIHRQHGNVGYLPNDLRRLAEILLGQGETAAALRYATEALAVAREIGNQFEIAEAFDHLARVAIEQSDLSTANAHARDSLRLAWQLGTQRQIWMALDRLGQIARHGDQHDRAIRLFAAACAVRTSTGEISAESAEREVQDYLADLRARDGEASIDTAWNDGAAMSREQAIAYALASPFTDAIGPDGRVTVTPSNDRRSPADPWLSSGDRQ